jgi:DNA polymerase-4
MNQKINIHPGSYDTGEGVHKITDYSCISSDMQHISTRERLYLHLDMNCFYAQVEQLCFNLYGMPVYIGGWYKPDGTPRGIVATSSYEARAYGIKTGMSAYEAEQICPYIIGLQAHYEKYKGISREIEELLHSFAMDVEKYSMDEYFLDITFLKNKPRPEIETYCRKLQNLLYEQVGLACSLGVSISKTYSKLASDLQKPRGITLIQTREEIEEKIYPLQLDEVWGIGRNRYRKLKKNGIKTIEQAVQRGHPVFQQLFGQYFGKLLYEMAAGKDRAKVLTPEDTTPDPKQLSYKHTFSDFTTDADRVIGEIMKAVGQLGYRMRGYRVKADKYYCFIQVQNRDFPGVGFNFKTDGKTNLDDYIYYECEKKARPALKQLLDGGFTIRGIGLGASSFRGKNQLNLFFSEDEKVRRFYLVQDAINNKYGKEMICKAAVKYDVPGKTHFLERS